jgi:hypothetical protein
MGPRSFGLPELVVILVIGFFSVFVFAYPADRICRKAGYSPWWGVLVVFPIANFVWVWYLGLADWPALREGGATLGAPC